MKKLIVLFLFALHLSGEAQISIWKMEGNSTDAFGLNSGTDHSVSYVQGRFGQAVSFAGSTSSYITTTDNSFPSGSNARTISFWIYETGHPVTEGTNMYYGTAGTMNQASGLFTYSSLGYQCSQWGSSVTVTSAYTQNRWYLITVTVSGSTWKVYVNGIYRNQSTTMTTSTTLTGTNYFGRGQTGYESTRYFQGYMDEIRIYSSVLADCQIYNLYIAGEGYFQ